MMSDNLPMQLHISACDPAAYVGVAVACMMYVLSTERMHCLNSPGVFLEVKLNCSFINSLYAIRK
jgi:hypothetical protein